MGIKGISYDEMMLEYRRRGRQPGPGRIEHISGVQAKLVYNPCLIRHEGHTYLAARVESPGSYWRDHTSWDPQIWFFKKERGDWVIVPQAPVFYYAEDPFATWVIEESGQPLLIFGVVSLEFGEDEPSLVTRFYKAEGPLSLNPSEPFLEVPGVKEIRLLQFRGRLAVCARPQGGEAGRGRMSLIVLDSHADLSTDVIAKAHLFRDQVSEETKIGINGLYDLGPNIGVLGHVAQGEEGGPLHYAAAWWTVDPITLTASQPSVIATRNEFPAGATKWPFTTDVVFPGALEKVDNGFVRLYCGLSDASIGSILMMAPF
jgi:hypothetical protein